MDWLAAVTKSLPCLPPSEFLKAGKNSTPSNSQKMADNPPNKLLFIKKSYRGGWPIAV